ncbi:MAG: hypothetical protein WBB19_15190 [Desulforhopalus sp.]
MQLKTKEKTSFTAYSFRNVTHLVSGLLPTILSDSDAYESTLQQQGAPMTSSRRQMDTGSRIPTVNHSTSLD